MNVFLSFSMNILMVGLLLATILYCRKLSARITILQDSRSELARIIREFDESTTKATESIAEIHKATARISDNIQHKIDKANFIANDLEYMIEKGNKLAGKVDTSPIRPARAPEIQAEPPRASIRAKIEDITAPLPSAVGDSGPRVRSRAEQELMTMLGKKNPNDSGS